MTGLDRALDLLAVVPHDGYRDGEVPQYRECPSCNITIRVDRTDLVAEHNRVCSNPLTKRELEVLRLIADGYTDAEIGRALLLSPHTVKSYVRDMHRKLGTHTRAGAVGLGFRQQLLR